MKTFTYARFSGVPQHGRPVLIELLHYTKGWIQADWELDGSRLSTQSCVEWLSDRGATHTTPQHMQLNPEPNDLRRRRTLRFRLEGAGPIHRPTTDRLYSYLRELVGDRIELVLYRAATVDRLVTAKDFGSALGEGRQPDPVILSMPARLAATRTHTFFGDQRIPAVTGHLFAEGFATTSIRWDVTHDGEFIANISARRMVTGL